MATLIVLATATLGIAALRGVLFGQEPVRAAAPSPSVRRLVRF